MRVRDYEVHIDIKHILGIGEVRTCDQLNLTVGYLALRHRGRALIEQRHPVEERLGCQVSVRYRFAWPENDRDVGVVP